MRLSPLARVQEIWRSLPLVAKIVQGVAVVLFLWGATCPGGTELGPKVPEGKGDVALYRAIVERVRHGEDYYRAAGQELHTREYATIPAFNWRLPTLAWLLSSVPSYDVARWLAWILGTATAVLWCFHLVRTKHELLSLVMVPLLLSMAPAWGGNGLMFHEMWSGQLISLSLALRLVGLALPSVLAGAAALSIRELALPFVVLMAVLAWRDGNRRESLGWIIVMAVFAVALTVHLSVARSLTPPDGFVNSWVAAGGWCHVLKTTRTNLVITLLPTPLLAAVVSLSWAGLWAWQSPGTERVAIVVSAYLAAFAIVGRPDNFYWGLMMAPILLLGIVGWTVALQRGGRR